MKSVILKRISGERIISNLIYATENNSFYKNMYKKFGLTEALVHPDLYDCLMKLVPVLEKNKLKLVIYDSFRPWDVQKYMYETAPDYLRPYIAPPPAENSKRGFHPRGTAIDCYLVKEDMTPLKYPTEPDAFYPGYENDITYSDYLKKAHRDYNGHDASPEEIKNRNFLEKIMIDIGLEPLPHEWWHFNLPDSWNYPIIKSLDDVTIE